MITGGGPKTESDNQTTNGGQDRIQLRNDAASVPTVHGKGRAKPNFDYFCLPPFVMMDGMRRKILAFLASLLCRCALSSLRTLILSYMSSSPKQGLSNLRQLGISLILHLIIPRPSVVTRTILGAAPVLLIMQM